MDQRKRRRLRIANTGIVELLVMGMFIVLTILLVF